VKPFKAIAAMSLNRVIGAGNRIPWHLPEDFKWFKQMTTGHIVVMGRRTFESIGRPLPDRTTVVLSRSAFSHPGVHVIRRLTDLLNPPDVPIPGLTAAVATREVFVCGGAQIYEQALPFCSDLFLTLVKCTIEGDTFFPPFEHAFELIEEILDRPEFKIQHWRQRSPRAIR
jgi:dihydrofolate reductase